MLQYIHYAYNELKHNIFQNITKFTLPFRKNIQQRTEPAYPVNSHTAFGSGKFKLASIQLKEQSYHSTPDKKG